MDEEQQQGAAEPIALEGETWVPPSEDDRVVTSERSPVLYGENGLRAGWAFVLYFFNLAVMLVILSPLGYFIKKHISPALVIDGRKLEFPSEIWLSHGTRLIAMIVASWTLSRLEGRRIAMYGLGIPSVHRLKQFFTGLVFGMAFLSLLVFVLKSAGWLVFDGVAEGEAQAVVYGLKWLLGMFVVATTEEYMMRGFFQFTLTRGFGGLGENRQRRTAAFWSTAVVMSVLFGLMHVGNRGETHLGIASAAMAGLVLCVSLWRSGSLWWGIGWHMGWNWAQSYLYGVGDSAIYSFGHLLNSHARGKVLMSGGAVGPEGSLFVFPTLILTAVVMWFSIPDEGYPEHQG